MINLPPRHLLLAVVIMTCTGTGQSGIAAAEAKTLNLTNAGIASVQNGTLAEKAANILTDEIAKRTGIDVPTLQNGPESGTPAILIQTLAQFNKTRLPADVELPHIADSYAIWIEDSLPAPTVILLGRDDRATLFAAGRLLRLLSMTNGRLEISAETSISSAPDVAIHRT